MLTVVPISLKQAKEFIIEHHSHHPPSHRWKFGAALSDGKKVVGVVVVGRPVNRILDDGLTLEVTRNCTDRTKNAASKLYGIARRVCKELGYKKLITYTLAEESGESLIAGGWTRIADVKGRSWDTPSRRRVDKHPTVDKVRWEIEL